MEMPLVRGTISPFDAAVSTGKRDSGDILDVLI